MHHIDVHVRDIASARRLLDAVAPHLGYERHSAEPDFVSYRRRGGARPSIGFVADDRAGSAMMQLAFGVPERDHVDRAARAALAAGALHVDGPAIHAEYGDDYYAVFFEDADGNKFEVLCDATTRSGG